MESSSNTDPYGYTNFNLNKYAHFDSDGDAIAIIYTDLNSNFYTYTYVNPNFYANTYTYANAYANTNGYSHGNIAPPCFTHIYTYQKTRYTDNIAT